MTPDEKNNMTLTIENAILKAFEKAFEVMDKKIETHRNNCPSALCETKRFVNSGISWTWLIGNWHKIVIGIVAVFWVISSSISAVKGTSTKFTSEQVQQIAQQILKIEKLLPPETNK